MRRLGHSAFIRILTCVFLLWIAIDFGAHGLLASDAPPLASASPSVSVGTEQGSPESCGSIDHCFCHSLSVGAVASVPVAELTPVGQTLAPLPTLNPQTDRHPLDLPPRFVA